MAPGGVLVERLETHGGPELMHGWCVHEILPVAQPDSRAAFMVSRNLAEFLNGR